MRSLCRQQREARDGEIAGGIHQPESTGLPSVFSSPPLALLYSRNVFLFFFLAAILLLTYSRFAVASWQWLHPWPQGNNLNAVCVLDEDEAFFAGEGGVVMHTTDGGESWDVQSAGEVAFKHYMQMFDDGTGYLLGDTTRMTGQYEYVTHLYKTEDHGRSWHKHSYLQQYALGCYFLNPDTGWIAGSTHDYYFISKSTDGGQTWEEQWVSEEYHGVSSFINKVFFLDEMHGWVATPQNRVFITSDGGEEWDEVQITDIEFGGPFDIEFLDEETGWAVGKDADTGYGMVIHTINGGYDWEVQFRDELRGRFMDIEIVSEETLIVLGFPHIIYRSADGGETWDTGENIDSRQLTRIGFDSTGDYGWCVGNNGYIISTTDSGLNWSQVNVLLSTSPFISMCFTDEDYGWALGIRTILHTQNGGDSWTYISLPQDISITRDIFFSSRENGWIVSATGVARSTDGGETWNHAQNIVDSSFTAITFTDSLTGWLTGYSGLLYKTEDGGESWELVDLETPYDLVGVFFSDTEHGWVYSNHTISGALQTVARPGKTCILDLSMVLLCIHYIFSILFPVLLLVVGTLLAHLMVEVIYGKQLIPAKAGLVSIPAPNFPFLTYLS